MNLKKLIMRNFRPFRGRHELDLTTPGASNLIVVFGENMMGKTALLNAIRWCLYGRVYSRTGQEIKVLSAVGSGESLLNSMAADNGEFEMEVSLEFDHSGRSYVLRRVASAPSRDAAHVGFRMQAYLLVDGRAVAEAEIDERVSQILNEEVSRFSLFDGEMLNEYEKLLADNEEEIKAVRGAIEKILGLPALTHGKVHLESIRSDAERELNREVRKQDKYRAAADRFEQLDDAVNGKGRECEQFREKLRVAEENLLQAKNELKGIEQFNVTFDVISNLEAQIESAGNLVDSCRAKVRGALSTEWWIPLSGRIKSLRDDLDRRLEEEVGLRRHSVEHELLTDAVKSGQCSICLRPLDGGSRERIMQKAKGLRATGSTGWIDGQMERVLSARRLTASMDTGRWAQVIVSASREIMQYETEISDKKARVEELRRSLGSISKGDYQKKIRTFENAEEQARGVREQLQRVELELQELSAEKETEAAKMGRFEGVNPEVRRRFAIASLLVRAFEAAISDFRERARRIVSKEADAIFSKLITQKDYQGLRITENYGLRIIDSRGNQLPGRSAGAEHIVALSLIGGLNRTAVGGQAPLVMDTNFGRLDRSHRRNVVTFVAGLDRQVVLLVHSGELDDRDLDDYGVQCARRYRIEKLSEWESEVVQA